MKKIGTKILTAFLLVGLVPAIIIAVVAEKQAEGALEDLSFNQLEAVRDIKKGAIENYFTSITNDLKTLSTDKAVGDAMKGFTLEFLDFGDSSDGMDIADESEIEGIRDAVNNYWMNEFGSEYQKKSGSAYEFEETMLSNQGLRLQKAFLVDNPNKLGEKNKMDGIPDEGRFGYNKYHLDIHPWFNDIVSRLGYYDLFLVDPDGNVVYSTLKEIDFASNLQNGIWKSSGLAEAYQKSLELEKGQVYFTDLAQYKASFNQPAAFASTPVYSADRRGRYKRTGTLIVQISLTHITSVMAERSGLGETGETYLVGMDRLMRSDSYRYPETHSVVNSFKTPETGMKETASARAALAGESGLLVQNTPDGEILSAYAPVSFGDHQWALLAEISADEALAPAYSLQIVVLILVLVIAVIIVIISLMVARSISSPIIELTKVMNRVKEQFDFKTRVHLTAKDEIGEAAFAFNALLDRTDKAMHEVNGIMHSISEGDFSKRVTSPLEGDLNALKQNVNASADSVENSINAVSGVMQAIVEGNFKMRLDDNVKGEFRHQVNDAIGSIDQSVEQIGELLHQLSEGNFAGRIEGNFRGDLANLKSSANQSMQQLQVAFDEILKSILAQQEGDLTYVVHADMKGEMAKLKQAINQSSMQLDGLVSRVVEASEIVGRVSGDLNEGSQQVNNRSQNQAATLEETSASMEELTSTIEQNTETAMHADELAKAAQAEADQGRIVMEQTENAITEIHDSSKQIEEITVLIDSIAFQTNLLALNAAVEAARAGEHGRGFAVVAGEVRNLASKSAEAAKDIKTLIEKMVISIENGTNKIEKTGMTLSRINQSIAKVTVMVSEISQASQEQQRGVQQVNTAIIQIDQMTQQNSALVEGTTAFSGAMSSESTKLQEAVSTFKTSGNLSKVIL